MRYFAGEAASKDQSYIAYNSKQENKENTLSNLIHRQETSMNYFIHTRARRQKLLAKQNIFETLNVLKTVIMHTQH